ncbi:UNVERIFIED_CONTAM: hypothetical protein NY100_33335, partial [Prevotella sp. 15_C9]
MEEFADFLDSMLQEFNSDYEAKRSLDITLQRLESISARRDLGIAWLISMGTRGGQHRIRGLASG